jgi:dolichol-phosphate mannosyltransferase
VIRVVLPAYNEADNLSALLEGLREAFGDLGIAYEVIVVDDGSRDQTADIAIAAQAKMPLALVRHPVNQGLGATLRDGLITALTRSGARDVIVTMDADNTHVPGLIGWMLALIDAGHDVVIASRYRPGARVLGVPWLRRVMSRGAAWLMRLVFPISGVRDYTSGYRAYRVEPLRRAVLLYGDGFIDQAGFQCMADVLFKLSRLELIFGEVPMLLRYDRKGGESKMRVASTAGSTLSLVLRRRFGG